MANSRLSDTDLYRALYCFVTAASPVLTALTRHDAELEQVDHDQELSRNAVSRAWASVSASSLIPGTERWHLLDDASRSEWWQHRLGTLSATLTAASRTTPLADKSGTNAALTIAVSGLLLCAIATEHGLNDIDQRVRLLGAVLFKRELQTSGSAAESPQPLLFALDELRAASPAVRIRRLYAVVLRLAEILKGAKGELAQATVMPGKRRFRDIVPGVSAVSAFGNARDAMRGVADAGRDWIQRQEHAPRDSPLDVASHSPVPLSQTGCRDVAQLYPTFYENILREARKPINRDNIVAIANLTTANLAVNAHRWLELVGTADDIARWEARFQSYETVTDGLLRRPDAMIDHLWAVSPRLHRGLRDFVKKISTTAREAAAPYGDELPFDMWGATLNNVPADRLNAHN
jgi:hypothetical protein